MEELILGKYRGDDAWALHSPLARRKGSVFERKRRTVEDLRKQVARLEALVQALLSVPEPAAGAGAGAGARAWVGAGAGAGAGADAGSTTGPGVAATFERVPASRGGVRAVGGHGGAGSIAPGVRLARLSEGPPLSAAGDESSEDSSDCDSSGEG